MKLFALTLGLALVLSSGSAALAARASEQDLSNPAADVTRSDSGARGNSRSEQREQAREAKHKARAEKREKKKKKRTKRSRGGGNPG